MKLSAAQSYFATRLNAAAALAPFVPVVVFDEFSADLEIEGKIDAALAATGVCIEVSETDASGGKTTSGRTGLVGGITIYAAESLTVAHAPKGVQLVEAIVAAACDQSLPGSQAVECTAVQAHKSERGYVLRIIDFTFPAQIS